MGYFDYLEESVALERENRYFDTYAKVGFWVGVGSFAVLLATILTFCFVSIGSIVWLDFLMAIGIAVAAVGMGYALKAITIARRRRNSSPLANFSFVWNLVFVLVNIILLVMNTWVYLG